MNCFISLLFLSAVLATLYSDLYKIEEYCPYEDIVFQELCPRIVATFETACSRVHALLRGDDCKKGFVTKPGVCHVKCVLCESRSDFCFDYVLHEKELYNYVSCFEFKSIGKRLVCMSVWMLTRTN